MPIVNGPLGYYFSACPSVYQRIYWWNWRFVKHCLTQFFVHNKPVRVTSSGLEARLTANEATNWSSSGMKKKNYPLNRSDEPSITFLPIPQLLDDVRIRSIILLLIILTFCGIFFNSVSFLSKALILDHQYIICCVLKYSW